MKSINAYFDDTDYKPIKKLKDELDVSWKDFIILLVKEYNQRDN